MNEFQIANHRRQLNFMENLRDASPRENPVVFFRPASQKIAIHDPLYGTCLATCTHHDNAKIESLVAARLGYAVNGVRTG